MVTKNYSPDNSETMNGGGAGTNGGSFEQLLEQHTQLAMQVDQLGDQQLPMAGDVATLGLDDVLDKICQVYSRIKGIGFIMAILKRLPVVGLLLQLLDTLCATRGGK